MDESSLLTWSQIKESDESKLLNSSSYTKPKKLHRVSLTYYVQFQFHMPISVLYHIQSHMYI